MVTLSESLMTYGGSCKGMTYGNDCVGMTAPSASYSMPVIVTTTNTISLLAL